MRRSTKAPKPQAVRNPETAPDRTREEARIIAERRYPMAKWTERTFDKLAWRGPEQAAMLTSLKRTIVQSAEQFGKVAVTFPGSYREPRWQLVRFMRDTIWDGWMIGMAGGYGIAWTFETDQPGIRCAVVYSLLGNQSGQADQHDLVWMEVPRDSMRVSFTAEDQVNGKIKELADAIGALATKATEQSHLIAEAYTRPCGICERSSSEITEQTGDVNGAAMLIVRYSDPGDGEEPWPICLGCYLTRPFEDRLDVEDLQIIDGDPGAECSENAAGFGTCWRISEAGLHLHVIDRTWPDQSQLVFAVRASGEQFEIVGRIMTMEQYLDALFGPEAE